VPLLNTPVLLTPSKERQRETLLLLLNQSHSFQREIPKESQREAKPLLYIHSPFPLLRGRGIKGDGVTINKGSIVDVTLVLLYNLVRYKNG